MIYFSSMEPTHDLDCAPLVRKSSRPWAPSPLSTTYVVTRELKTLDRPLTEPHLALMTASYRNNGTQTFAAHLRPDIAKVSDCDDPKGAIEAKMRHMKEISDERLRLAAKLRAEHASAAQAQREATRARTKARWEDRKEAELAKLMTRHNRGKTPNQKLFLLSFKYFFYTLQKLENWRGSSMTWVFTSTRGIIQLRWTGVNTWSCR
ncbi:uncharacterized protein LOC132197560 [Neocloeon triangulifer]|uniref:uncharacterized protein LOC132197560 n=1 Tax=Neocloeon triangulifer TaxID=2078957 RepID=UPI00286F3B58|nr:uncharacterized protein LOC132197560 [Neocloeon triangulifer]